MKKTMRLGLALVASLMFSSPALVQAKTADPLELIINSSTFSNTVSQTAPSIASEYRPTRRVSYGRQYHYEDPLGLRASVALVVDQNSWTVQYGKNSNVRSPVASITKLMTALVTLDSGTDLNEMITITREDVGHYPSSRLSEGTMVTRRDLMHLALMSSENRAAYALGRTYPGGLYAFVGAMNAKAQSLGMRSATFVDPSGLSPSNQASAIDLSKMLNAATHYPLIRELSTSNYKEVYTSRRLEVYRNSNRLISRNTGWDIGIQKTGTLSAAGKCVVLQANINGAPKLIILLDSSSSDSRVTDAVAIKQYLEYGGSTNSNSNRGMTFSLNDSAQQGFGFSS